MERLRLLVLTPMFPSRVQPWLLNGLAQAARRNADIWIVAAKGEKRNYPAKVDELRLLERTTYYPADSIRDLIGGLGRYAGARKGAKQAYIGLYRLLRYGGFAINGGREWMKAMIRAPIAGGVDRDLVHSHRINESYEYLGICRALNVPLVTTFHGLPPKGVKLLEKRKRSMVFEHGDRFIVNTRFAESQLVSLGCDRDKIRILPQGTDLSEYPFCPSVPRKGEKIVVLTVGRFHEDKGHRFAIDAIELLLRKGVQVEYRMVGAGPEKDTLVRIIKSKGLEHEVKVFEAVSDDELRNHYKDAHVFVLPSLRDRDGYHEETQGVVIQEAQASGLIVVATRTGGIPECVEDGVSGFLVTDRDPQALANTLNRVISHQHQWPVWQRQGRAAVERKFDGTRIGDAMWELYGEVVNQYRSNRRLPQALPSIR